MRLNRYIANATGSSRRAADDFIAEKRVQVNGQVASLGQRLDQEDVVFLDGKLLETQDLQYVLLNKPVGYVCSRVTQGKDPTIYDLLPKNYRSLKPVGRLDKDSSGLLLLTNDGMLAQALTHPSRQKNKTYIVKLDKPLSDKDRESVEKGVELKDGISKLKISVEPNDCLRIEMKEGKNRQIRRTFGKLGYSVIKLERIEFGNYKVNDLSPGKYKEIYSIL